jgi:hypothetical protein
MVAKKSSGKKGGRVKVGKLKLTKETVKDLTKTEAKKIKGGGTRKNAICAANIHWTGRES